MSYLEAVILGIIQGLTEFLPVSSSGHLEIVKAIFGKNPEENMTFTVVLHLATALSTIIVFRKDILDLLRGLLAFKNNEETRFSIKIILSMIPAVVVGLVFEEELEQLFSGNLLFVGSMLWMTALLLFVADRAKTTHKDVSFTDSIVIGIAQAIAILPGISRSGATISASVILKVDRQKAARFSFLMVVPLILGKVAKDILGGKIDFHSTSAGYMTVGFISAFVVGFWACTRMIEWVKNAKLTYFALYCFLAGAIAVAYALFF